MAVMTVLHITCDKHTIVVHCELNEVSLTAMSAAPGILALKARAATNLATETPAPVFTKTTYKCSARNRNHRLILSNDTSGWMLDEQRFDVACA